MIVDVSVFVDALFVYDEGRSRLAFEFLKALDEKGHDILEPEVFGIELISQLVRRRPREVSKKIYDEIMQRVIIVDDIEYDTLFEIALTTGCRAIDAYYIAVAYEVSDVLVSSDKVMVDNARKHGVEAYYLPAEFEKVMKKL